MLIDSHQHFWSTQRPNDYGFLTPDAGVLYRDYLPTDLAPDLEKLDVAGTILVQAAQTLDETEWLFRLSEPVAFVRGVVAWIDMTTGEATFERQLRQLQRHEKFVAVRPMLQELEDDRWILQPSVLANLKLLAQEGVPFDILVYPRHLPHIAEMLDEVPDLPAVIDHLAKPFIRRHELEPWARWMTVIAGHANVLCKLSGMVTEADHTSWRPEDFEPYVNHVLKQFGPNRAMFGSDWPVCLQAASYQQVYQLLQRVLPKHLEQQDRDAIFGGNAAAFYRLASTGT